MNGTQLWRAVRREFKKHYPTGTIHRVENTLENGMSDCVWGADGKVGWIELKGDGDKENPLQAAFRRKWSRAGCNASVLMWKDDGFVLIEKWVLGDVDFRFDTLAEAIMFIVGG